MEGEADGARGPYLLLVRHASSGDALLASSLVSAPNRMQLRCVLKRELLWDPCLDIVGNWLPNVFAERDAPDSSRIVRSPSPFLITGSQHRDGRSTLAHPAEVHSSQ